MSDQYVGEVRMFAGTRAPSGWAFCDGQTLSISEYPALFGAIEWKYGGDGVKTFQLPDLRGRVPVHRGSGFVTGQSGGVENVALTSVTGSPAPEHDNVQPFLCINFIIALEGNFPFRS